MREKGKKKSPGGQGFRESAGLWKGLAEGALGRMKKSRIEGRECSEIGGDRKLALMHTGDKTWVAVPEA
jgi:hypothetical protein